MFVSSSRPINRMLGPSFHAYAPLKPAEGPEFFARIQQTIERLNYRDNSASIRRYFLPLPGKTPFSVSGFQQDALIASSTLKGVYCEPRASSELRAQRDVAKQGGEPSDHGGHILSFRFFPNKGAPNLWPQAQHCNQSPYKKLENTVAKRLATPGETVGLVVASYMMAGPRPSNIHVRIDETSHTLPNR